MRKILILILCSLSTFMHAQMIRTDSLDLSLQVANDTVIFPLLGYAYDATSMLAVEFVYTGLDQDDAYLGVGYSNTGITFNFASTLFGASADSVQLDVTTNKKIVNGAYSGMTAVATKQASMMFVGSVESGKGKYFGIYVNKGSVTSGKIYYYIRQ